MCGRYSLSITLKDLLNRYHINNKANIEFSPKNEIFPSQKAPIVKETDDKTDIKLYKWGFSPSFTNNLIINARGESVDQKPTFKNSFLNKRCLIPVTGFYEWQNTDNKKNKYNITVKNEKVFSLAGIYDSFKNNNGDIKNAFSIITISANKKINPIHHRMPVIIEKQVEKTWLNSKIKNRKQLKNMLKPFPDENILKIPV